MRMCTHNIMSICNEDFSTGNHAILELLVVKLESHVRWKVWKFDEVWGWWCALRFEWLDKLLTCLDVTIDCCIGMTSLMTPDACYATKYSLKWKFWTKLHYFLIFNALSDSWLIVGTKLLACIVNKGPTVLSLFIPLLITTLARI